MYICPYTVYSIVNCQPYSFLLPQTVPLNKKLACTVAVVFFGCLVCYDSVADILLISSVMKKKTHFVSTLFSQNILRSCASKFIITTDISMMYSWFIINLRHQKVNRTKFYIQISFANSQLARWMYRTYFINIIGYTFCWQMAKNWMNK